MTHSLSSLSRRRFLGSGAAAAAALALPSPALLAELTQAGGSPSPVRLGLCSYTFREFDRTHVIEWMKQLHITLLNAKDTKDHLPMDPAAEAQALAAYSAAGIRVHAVGAVYFREPDEDDIRRKFEDAQRAGVKVIVAGDPAPEALPIIEKYVRKHDIRFAIHNHGPEDKIYHSPLDVLRAVGKMDPRMGCCIDVGHCVRAGTDVIEAIHAAGPRLFDMHIKDLDNFTEKESQVAVGEGKMPIRAIFAALAKIRYAGVVDLEYEIHGDDPLPGTTESFAYMRGVLSGMGYNWTSTT